MLQSLEFLTLRDLQILDGGLGVLQGMKDDGDYWKLRGKIMYLIEEMQEKEMA